MPDREVAVVMRTSVAGRNELKRRANRQGLSLQAYLETLIWGKKDVERRSPGRPRLTPSEQENLSLTG